MTKALIIWWGLFAALTVALLSGQFRSSTWLGVMWGSWLIMGISYSLSAKSTASTGKKISNLVIAATVLAAFAYIREGEPSTDEDGYSEGGYNADHKDRSSAAVGFFFKIMISGYVGIFLSDFNTKKKEKGA